MSAIWELVVGAVKDVLTWWRSRRRRGEAMRRPHLLVAGRGLWRES